MKVELAPTLGEIEEILSPRLRRVFVIFVCCSCCGPCTGPGHVLPCRTHQAELLREILETRRRG